MILPVGLALVGLTSVLVATSRWGPGLDSDSVGYIWTAQRWRGGDGLRAFAPVWPPLFSFVLAAVAQLTTFGEAGVGRFVNAGAFATTIVLGIELLRGAVRSRLIVVLGAMAIATMPVLLAQAVTVLTEPLFITFILAFVVALNRLVTTWRWSTLGVTVALAWAAFLTRYLGVTTIAVGTLVLLVVPRARPHQARARVREALTFCIAAAAVPAAWLAHNRATFGFATGEHAPADEGVKRNLVDLTASFGRTVTGRDALSQSAALAAAALAVTTVGALAVVAPMISARRAGTSRGEVPTGAATSASAPPPPAASDGATTVVLGAFTAVFAVSLLLLRSVSAFDRIDWRLLSPIAVPLFVLTFAAVDRALEAAGTSRVRTLLIGVVGAGVLWTVVSGGLLLRTTWQDGTLFSGRTYEAVRADPALASVPLDCTIYSNQPAVMFFAGRQAEASPSRVAYGSRDPSDDLRRFGDAARAGPICLVWVSVGYTSAQAYTPEDLSLLVRLEPVATGPTVAVYRTPPT